MLLGYLCWGADWNLRLGDIPYRKEQGILTAAIEPASTTSATFESRPGWKEESLNIQTNPNVPLDAVHILEKKRKSGPGIGIAVGLLVMVFFLLPGTAKAVVCTSQIATGNWS